MRFSFGVNVFIAPQHLNALDQASHCDYFTGVQMKSLARRVIQGIGALERMSKRTHEWYC